MGGLGLPWSGPAARCNIYIYIKIKEKIVSGLISQNEKLFFKMLSICLLRLVMLANGSISKLLKELVGGFSQTSFYMTRFRFLTF